MPKYVSSWEYYMYYVWLLCIFSVRKYIFSGTKQCFHWIKFKEIDVSNDVKINSVCLRYWKKNFFVEFFKNTTHLDKWWCAIINFKIGLKWSMIQKVFRKSFKLQTDIIKKYQIKKCSLRKYCWWFWFS